METQSSLSSDIGLGVSRVHVRGMEHDACENPVCQQRASQLSLLTTETQTLQATIKKLQSTLESAAHTREDEVHHQHIHDALIRPRRRLAIVLEQVYTADAQRSLPQSFDVKFVAGNQKCHARQTLDDVILAAAPVSDTEAPASPASASPSSASPSSSFLPRTRNSDKQVYMGYCSSLELADVVTRVHIEFWDKTRMKKMLGQGDLVLSEVEEIKAHTPTHATPKEREIVMHTNFGETTPFRLRLRLLVVTSYASQPVPLHALVASWNTANPESEKRELHDNTPEDFESWLPSARILEAGIVAVGTQENDQQAKLCHLISRHLAASNGVRHHLLCAPSVGEMRLYVWVRTDVLAGIVACTSDLVKTGIGGIIANKGGVAVGLVVWDTSVAIINSHLAAHQGCKRERHGNWGRIVSELDLGGFRFMETLQSYDHKIWCGDLNYRLDLPEEFGPNTSAEKAPKEAHDKLLASIAKGASEWQRLLDYDQLLAGMRDNEVFVGWSDTILSAPVTFRPTFKVSSGPGIDAYNEKRLPAYCDRVLWHSAATLSTDDDKMCRGLWSSELMRTSDHKPVAAHLVLQLRPHRPRWWPESCNIKGKLASLRRPRIITTTALQSAWGSSSAANAARISVRPTLYAWRMTMITAKATGLRIADVSGSSDPFLVFQGSSLMPANKMSADTSKFLPRTLSPEWVAEDLPALTLVGTTEDSLRDERLFITVMDYDLGSQPDLLGTAVLDGFVDYIFGDGLPKPGIQSYTLDLIYKGVKTGDVSGTFTLELIDPVHTGAFLKRKARVAQPKPMNHGAFAFVSGRRSTRKQGPETGSWA